MGLPTPRRVNYKARKHAAEAQADLQRSFPAPRLSVELVPVPCWGRNLRSRVSFPLWESVRQWCLASSHGKCLVCGASGSRARIECHEVWDYQDTVLVQRLAAVVPLCSLCHEAKHSGLANVRGRARFTERRLRHLNEWSEEQLDQYLALTYHLWALRSKNNWRRDYWWLADNGFPYRPRTPRANPSLHPTPTNWLRHLPSAGELKR